MSLDDQVASPIRFTDLAASKIKEFAPSPDQPLRIGIQGGGCSGFTYALGFDDPREGDTRYEHNGIPYLLDPVSERYLAGTRVDYVDTFLAKGFRFENPNATARCGCGSSFGV